MTLKKRLGKLEARVTQPKQGIPQPPTPDVIELLAQEIIWQLKNRTSERELLLVVPELLRSEHVPQELKRELEALWCLRKDTGD